MAMIPTTKEMRGWTAPSNYKAEVAARVLVEVANNGVTLLDATERAGVPYIGWYSWVNHDSRLLAALNQAREWGIEARLKRAQEVLDDMIGCNEKSGPAVSAANNLASFHKWVAEKHHSALYGTRIKQDIAGNMSVSISKDDDAL